MTDPAEVKSTIVRVAAALGFARVGVAAAGPSARARRFGEFLRRGYHAEMSYLARDPVGRADVRGLLAGAASVICLAVSYASPEGAGAGRLARYARGRDYHRLLRKRCRRLVEALRAAAPDARTRICVDTAPLLERDLAAAAGIGWIGRNGCVIGPELGSYLLLAEIVTDLPLPPDASAAGRCGRCRRCIDACPTAAIAADGLVDSRRCVSYLTIEHRGPIPDEFRPAVAESIFGCDVCQEVCPFNRPEKTPPGDAELTGPREIARAEPADVLNWTQADWDRLTRGSAARRARHESFLRNAALVCGNTGDPAARGALERLAAGGSPTVAGAARWALERMS